MEAGKKKVRRAVGEVVQLVRRSLLEDDKVGVGHWVVSYVNARRTKLYKVTMGGLIFNG
jgi:hypothetical protein